MKHLYFVPRLLLASLPGHAAEEVDTEVHGVHVSCAVSSGGKCGKFAKCADMSGGLGLGRTGQPLTCRKGS